MRLLYDPIDESKAVASKGKVVETGSDAGLIEAENGEVRSYFSGSKQQAAPPVAYHGACRLPHCHT